MQPIKSGELSGSAQLVERQMLLWNARQRAHETAEEKAHIYRFLTISRDIGSLGDPLAAGLASHLGWHVYDREIVDYIAQNSHVRQNLVQQFDEKDQNLIHDTVRRLLGMIEGGTFGADDYHEALYKTLVSLGTRGRAIFIGRGANFVLKGHPGLHIRVVASPDVRVERLCLRWHVTQNEARQRMRHLDLERKNYIRHHFGQDPDDPGHYDLLLNTDHISPEQAVASVLSVMKVQSAGSPI